MKDSNVTVQYRVEFVGAALDVISQVKPPGLAFWWPKNLGLAPAMNDCMTIEGCGSHLFKVAGRRWELSFNEVSAVLLLDLA